MNKDLSVSYAPGIENDVKVSQPLRHALGMPPLHEKLILGTESIAPEVSYLTWHRENVFVSL